MEKAHVVMTAISPSPFHLRRRKDMSKDDLRQGNRFATVEAYQPRLASKSSFLECVGVGDGKDGFVYLLCTDCGSLFHKSKSKIRPSRTNRLVCPQCEHILSIIHNNEKSAELKVKRDLLNAEKTARKIYEKEKAKHQICEYCGKEFSGRKRKYCSDICMKKQSSATKSHIRRLRIQNKPHDNIPLRKLEERDKCICWLCGGKTNRTDRIIHDCWYEAGPTHPSIDHVIPLAKGGTHTWNNVRLAHWKCNSLRGASLIVEKQDGQMKFVI